MSALDWISQLLVVVGALNGGLVGIGTSVAGSDALTSWNLANLLLGSVPTLEALVYLLVGLAGRYELYFGYHLYAARGARAESSRTT